MSLTVEKRRAMNREDGRSSQGRCAAPSQSKHSPERPCFLHHSEPKESRNASEAFLIHAFNLICQPDTSASWSRRSLRDRSVVHTVFHRAEREPVKVLESDDSPGVATLVTADCAAPDPVAPVSPNEPDDGAPISPNEPNRSVEPSLIAVFSPNELPCPSEGAPDPMKMDACRSAATAQERTKAILTTLFSEQPKVGVAQAWVASASPDEPKPVVVPVTVLSVSPNEPNLDATDSPNEPDDGASISPNEPERGVAPATLPVASATDRRSEDIVHDEAAAGFRCWLFLRRLVLWWRVTRRSLS